MTLRRNLSLGELEEAMVPRVWWKLSWQKHIENKTPRNCKIRNRDDPGKYIAKISASEGRQSNKEESEADSGWPRRPEGAATGLATPPGRLAHREIPSGSSSVPKFFYFLETANTELLYLFAKFFLPKCIPIPSQVLSVIDTWLQYVPPV